MGFFTYLPYIVKGLEVFNILIEEIPKIIEDEKISVEEIISIFKRILAIFSMPVDIIIPDELKYKVFEIKREDK